MDEEEKTYMTPAVKLKSGVTGYSFSISGAFSEQSAVMLVEFSHSLELLAISLLKIITKGLDSSSKLVKNFMFPPC